MCNERVKQRKQYIDGLKGISCILIFLGHFSSIYKTAESAPKLEGFAANAMTNYPLRFFFDENFWLYLFFIVSGYLLAYNWKGKTFQSIIRKIVIRFIRLAIPVLGAGVLIYLIQNTWGFCNGRFSEIGKNTWFMCFYPASFSLTDVLLEPFHVLLCGYSITNVPFWVLKDMFFASCAIFVCCAVYERECSKYPVKTICMTVFWVFLSLLLKSRIMITCLMGMCTVWLEEWGGLRFRNKPYEELLSLIGVTSPFLIYSLKLLFLKPVAFLLVVISIPHIPVAERLLSKKPLLFLGKISFGIYALHFPVICSAGFGSLLYCLQYVNGSAALQTSLAISSIVTVLFAILFHVSVERVTDFVCSKAASFL